MLDWCWVLGVGCWVLGVGCWVLGVGCWVLGVGICGVKLRLAFSHKKSTSILEVLRLILSVIIFNEKRPAYLKSALTETFGSFATLPPSIGAPLMP